MRFLRRSETERDAPRDFWTWWSANRDRVRQAIDAGGFDDRLINEIAAAVRTVHPALGWELEPGKASQHAFCVSPEGNAEVRQAAIRWLAGAPPADATWEYHASKQAAARLMGLEVAGRRFDLEEMRAITTWDEARRRIDVRLWHPGFEGAPEQVKIQVGFVFLDSLLGEDDVERWIGQIDILEAPSGGRAPAELRSEVERRTAESVGDETWIVLKGTSNAGESEVITANAALKRIDYPFHDHHVTIDVLMGIDRPPNEVEADLLETEQADLIGRLGGAAIFVGRSTKVGGRTLHFVTEDPDGMRPAIDGWAAEIPDSLSEGQPQRRLKINFDHDMDWSFQRELGIR